MATYQTNAIVLKREDVFEADRLYHLYTKDFGRVRATAGGARKINAKLAGHLEPFSLIWSELMTKKNGDLFITTALSEKQFLSRSASPLKIALFFKMADLVLKMVREPQKDDALWDFLLNNFSKAGLAADSDEFLRNFKNNFINILGFGDDFSKAGYYLNDFDVL